MTGRTKKKIQQLTCGLMQLSKRQASPQKGMNAEKFLTNMSGNI